MTRTQHLAHAAACALALVLAGAPAEPAQAASTKPHAKAHRARSSRDSGETVSERERRLYRECRGRPNAGACEGYAR